MIDYYSHALALDKVSQTLAAKPFTDAVLVSARDQTTMDLSLAGDYALLGAFVNHLFTHAASDGSELTLLARAADLWRRGVALYETLSAVRGDFEKSLADPSDPSAVEKFNDAALNVQLFAQKAQAMQTEVVSLREDVVKFSHVPPHPRQLDKASKSWDWGNLLLGRRTDAFVRSLGRLAHNSPTRAFAFGALTGYGANVSGSAYIGHTVGGPRRAHRYRDRVARNTIGSWLARQYATLSPPKLMAKKVRFGTLKKPTLPAVVEKLLKDAVTATFDLSKTGPVPDVQSGYRRLIKHLELLDDFVRPTEPQVPSGIWANALYGDPSNPPPSLRPQDVGLSGDPGGGVSLGSNTTGDPQPGSDDSSKTSKGCGLLILLLIVIDLIQAFVQCVVQWANKKTCTFWDNMMLKKLWEKDPPDPRDPPPTQNVDATASQLTAMYSNPQVVQFIGCLFDLQVQIWEALDKAYHFLSLHGLIYPSQLIDLPDYNQFTSIPAMQQWPHRSDNNPIETFHMYPNSQLENQTVAASQFPVAAKPDAFLPLAAAVALPLWQQMARDEKDTENFDMDADRGVRHQCWETVGSINNDPVVVGILAYSDQ